MEDHISYVLKVNADYIIELEKYIRELPAIYGIAPMLYLKWHALFDAETPQEIHAIKKEVKAAMVSAGLMDERELKPFDPFVFS